MGGNSSLRTTWGYTHFLDDFRKQVAAGAGLFDDGPNGPKLAEGQTSGEAA
jgi:hypothetical protein